MTPSALLRLASPGALAGRLLVAFAFYAAALDLGMSAGLVAVAASPPGLALLAASGLSLLWAAVRAARAAGPPAVRIARAMILAGLGVALVALPASLATRAVRAFAVGEGQEIGPSELPGLPPLRFGEARLAPAGPHVLSKTVEIEATTGGERVRIGLFPPRSIGGWRFSITRFGYAPGVRWTGAGAPTPIVEAHVMMGTLPHTEEELALVKWTPVPDVMMGAGTFPPVLEELVSPRGAGAHLFLRLDEATIAGARRDLRDPDAHRWLVDGRLEDAVFHVEVFHEREKRFEGRLRAGEHVAYPGGAVALAPEVLLWVDLVATRDPWLPWIGVGLALLVTGLAFRGARALATLPRRIRTRRTPALTGQPPV